MFAAEENYFPLPQTYHQNDIGENSQGNKHVRTSFKNLIIYALSIGWNKNS